MKRRALGKGLAALLPDAPPRRTAKEAAGANEVAIDQIDLNPYQPRQHVEQANIEELARSLSQQGVVQPLLVRRVGSRFQIIAGERRLRAARRAGIERVPVIVRDVPDEQLLELALVENIQREDLNPIEEARAYQRLIGEIGFSQEQVADRVGKDRSTVANLLRLLRLPQVIQQAIAEQKLSPGHARPLLALTDSSSQAGVAREIMDKGLSVREVERRVKTLARSGAGRGPSARPTGKTADANTRAAEDRLRAALGTRVRIQRKGRGGAVEIAFYSEEDLQRIYEILLRGARRKTSSGRSS